MSYRAIKKLNEDWVKLVELSKGEKDPQFKKILQALFDSTDAIISSIDAKYVEKFGEPMDLTKTCNFNEIFRETHGL